MAEKLKPSEEGVKSEEELGVPLESTMVQSDRIKRTGQEASADDLISREMAQMPWRAQTPAPENRGEADAGDPEEAARSNAANEAAAKANQEAAADTELDVTVKPRHRVEGDPKQPGAKDKK